MSPEPRDVWHCEASHVGARVLFFASLPSTNDLALQLNEPGTAIVADVQTAGRGQYQRVWQSRPGCSLLISVCVAPPPELLRPVLLIAWAAVAVAETILTLTGQQARIKWPNDILIDGRKVCGILTERERNAVIGIGLNLSQTAADFASERLPGATSLTLATGIICEPANVVSVLLRKLDSGYDRLLHGDRAALESDWKRRIGLLGYHVRVEMGDGSVTTGRLKEMSFEGIELEAGDGAFEVLAPEHVRHLSPA